MDPLVDLLHPDLSITTGITPVHVANFKNLDQLIGEKCKILHDTLSRNATALIGENCLNYPQFRRIAHRCTPIGQGQNIQRFPSFTRFYPMENNQIRLRGPHFHGTVFTLPEMSLGQRENFARAATVAKILGLDDEIIQERILQWQPSRGRGETLYFRGHRVYSDAYNANPMAMLDALHHFDSGPSSGNTYVLGGMVELGAFSERYHRQLAQYFHGKCGDLIIAIGAEMGIFYEILRQNKGVEVAHFGTIEAARDYFQGKCRGRIFIKGSHDYHLERILAE
jgi:UDP-N-acetylmuramoyl-tripeptide--D-alanyl-D-alanine ligase